MIVLIITGLIAVLLTYLDQTKYLRNGMKYGFIIVTFIAAIHYDFGNDYMVYYGMFQDWSNLDWSWDFSDYKEVYKNPGWVILNLLFKPFGFFAFVAFLSIFQNWIYYGFIKKYVPRGYWTWAVIFYLFSVYFYLINMSMMRQGLTVALFVWALPMIFERKWLPATVILLLAYSIHTTGLVLLPFLLLAVFPIKNGRVVGLILLFSFILMMVFKNQLGLLLKPLDVIESMEEISEKLDRSQMTYGGLESIGVGFVLKCIPFFVGVWFLLTNQTNDSRINGLVFVSSFGTLFIPLGFHVYMITRASIYFYAVLLAAIPYSFQQIKSNNLRQVLLASFMFIILYEYWGFIFSPTYSPFYSQFHSIFDVLI